MSARLPYRRPAVVSVSRSPAATDVDLVRACIAGDRAAWAELHRRYHRLVRAKIRQRAVTLGRRDAIDDAEQEWWLAFPRIVQAWCPGPSASICTWLHHRAAFQLDRFLHKTERKPAGRAFEHSRPLPPNPEEQLGSAELSCSVRAAASTAARTPRDRELLEERLLADEPLTLQAIATRHGVTRQAIEDGQRKLLSRLAEVLSPLAA